MDRWNGGVLVILLMVAVFAGSGAKPDYALSGDKPSSSQVQQNSAAASSSPREVTGADYQDARLKSAIAQTTGITLPSQSAVAERQLAFVIATVPHPTGTHLAITFDRTVEAIQQATQDSGYLFDRAVMPWDEREYPVPGDFRARLSEDMFNRGKHDVPGALIFRRAYPQSQTDGMPAYLVVLLVAEKPTEGLNGAQFKAALKLARDSGYSRLLVLGPLFSGSLNSLRTLLTNDPPPFTNISVISGTATNPIAIRSFRDSLEKSNFRFQTLQYTDYDAIAALLDYAHKTWGYQDREIAIVSEDETAYGTLESDSKQSSSVLSLSFPRNISHLRDAYEQQVRERRAANVDSRVTRSVLNTFLTDSRPNADTVPTYGGNTPASQESVLLGLAMELRRHRIRLVVLAATDPLDLVFLVRYFRSQHPAAQVITMGADSLLRHESDATEMRGVMTLSTYSLRPAAEMQMLYPQNHERQRVFPSSDTKGTYNAARALLGCLDQKRSRGLCGQSDNAASNQPGFDASGLFEYGPSRLGTTAPAQNRPELKLDALGADAFYPVAALSVSKAQYPPIAMDSKREQRPTSHLSRSFTLLTALLCGALFGLLFVLSRASAMSTWEAAAIVAPVPKSRLRWGLTVAVCALAYLLFALPLWVLANWGVMTGKYRATSVAASLGVLVACPYIVLLRKRYSGKIAGAFSVIAGLVLLLGVLVSLFRGAGFRSFIERSAAPVSGVSPLVPLLILTAALLWWCWQNLAGAALVDSRRARLPDIARGPSRETSLPDELINISESQQRRLLKALRSSPWDIGRIVIAVVVTMLVAKLAVGTFQPLATLEPVSFDHVLVFLVLLAVALMVYECFRIVWVWSELKRLLQALETQPFRGVFNLVREFSWKMMWRVGAGCLQEANRRTIGEIEALRAAEQASQCGTSELWQSTAAELRYQYLGLKRQALNIPFAPVHMSRPIATGEFQAVAAQPAMEPAIITEAHLMKTYARLQRNLAKVAARFLQDARTQTLIADVPDQKQSEKRLTPAGKQAYFVCLVYVKYVMIALLRIRTLAVSVAGVFVLVTLALTSYPVEPLQIIRSCLLLLCLGLVAVIAIVYAQMHRDTTLSRITDTDAGTLGRDFWWRMVPLVGLPLISLLAYQFPLIGNVLFSWVEPFVKSMR